MTDAYSIWNPINLIFSENFLQVALTLNVILTLFLVLQSIHNRKLLLGRTLPNGNKRIIDTKADIPPFIDGTVAKSSGKKTADIDTPKIARAIKMIKDGYSKDQIMDVLDIESAYIKILEQNYKVSES
jgi:hypothetical protein